MVASVHNLLALPYPTEPIELSGHRHGNPSRSFRIPLVPNGGEVRHVIGVECIEFESTNIMLSYKNILVTDLAYKGLRTKLTVGKYPRVKTLSKLVFPHAPSPMMTSFLVRRQVSICEHYSAFHPTGNGIGSARRPPPIGLHNLLAIQRGCKTPP